MSETVFGGELPAFYWLTPRAGPFEAPTQTGPVAGSGGWLLHSYAQEKRKYLGGGSATNDDNVRFIARLVRETCAIVQNPTTTRGLRAAPTTWSSFVRRGDFDAPIRNVTSAVYLFDVAMCLVHHITRLYGEFVKQPSRGLAARIATACADLHGAALAPMHEWMQQSYRATGQQHPELCVLLYDVFLGHATGTLWWWLAGTDAAAPRPDRALRAATTFARAFDNYMLIADTTRRQIYPELHMWLEAAPIAARAYAIALARRAGMRTTEMTAMLADDMAQYGGVLLQQDLTTPLDSDDFRGVMRAEWTDVQMLIDAILYASTADDDVAAAADELSLPNDANVLGLDALLHELVGSITVAAPAPRISFRARR